HSVLDGREHGASIEQVGPAPALMRDGNLRKAAFANNQPPGDSPMKVFGLHASIYRAANLASRLPSRPTGRIIASRRDALSRWRQARANGLSATQAAHAVGVSRATLYRWQQRIEPRSRRPHRRRTRRWGSDLIGEVEALRGQYPMWGKRKITVLLRRAGRRLSVSTTGRVLRQLMERGRVTPVPVLRRKPGRSRFRLIAAQRHARRLPKGTRPTRSGELVQIDTLFVNVAPETSIKHFTAYDPAAEWTLGLVARNATAGRATALLDKLIAEAPFPIRGVQVDGGSEFMAEFERTCAAKALTLFVLPPKRPQLNGAVERAQSSWRYEFYACTELPTRIAQLQPLVDRFAHHFNHVRPHQALGDLTPAEYLKHRSQGDHAPSHMG
ncbi:MAG: integrase core domain-containing protein, partial [Acetobacteraceae bacterium]